MALTLIFIPTQPIRLGQVKMHKGSEHHSPSNLDSINNHAQQEHIYDKDIEFTIRQTNTDLFPEVLDATKFPLFKRPL